MQPHNAPYHPRKPRSRRRLFLFLTLAVALAGGVAGLRMREAWALRETTRDDAAPLVAVVTAESGPAEETLVLPGTVEAWHDAPIYARTSGYLAAWKTDIGTRVKAGQLLAEIAAPEVDAQLRQAEAEAQLAAANAQLADITAKRWKALLKTNAVSKQEADEKISDAAAKAASLASARANRDRLRDLASFKRVTAPFSGTITARTTDIGALITSGSGSGAGPELFHIADTSRLRIYVQVPQKNAGSIRPHMTAELHFTEHPGKTFTATLLKTAEVLDPTNRTLLTQFTMDNADGALLAGGYTQVHLALPTAATTLRLPVNTLLFRSEGLQVATVDAQSRAVLRPVTMGRDDGKIVEISAGLDAGDKVIVNPPDSLANGQLVRVQAAAPTAAAADKKAK